VFVGILYVSPTTRPSPQLSRDAPSVIRGRIRAVTLSCIITTVSTFLIITSRGHFRPIDAFHLLGWWPVGLTETAKSVALTIILFLGPLYEKGIVEEGWKSWIRGNGISETLGGWIGWRNLVAVCPFEQISYQHILPARRCEKPLMKTL
jgi:prenyl protein peptidase